MPEILVKLETAQSRRWSGVFMLAALGAMLLYVVATHTESGIPELAALAIVGGIFVWAALRLYRSTEEHLVLTRETLETSAGEVICKVSDIASTDRGFFAFKPTNGFLIRLETPGTRRWAPGLWWRIGKRVGIGGVTSPRQAKEMVAMIDLMIIERERG